MTLSVSDSQKLDLDRRIALHEVDRLWNKIPEMEGNHIAKPMIQRCYLLRLASWEKRRWYIRRNKLLRLAKNLYASAEGSLQDAIADAEATLRGEFTHVHGPTT
jgi:hypothetical protein